MRYGSQSLQVAYQNDAKLTASRTLTQADRYVSLWVYGDGSGSILSAAFSYEDGTPVTQSLATLNFTGWKQVSAAVPGGGGLLRRPLSVRFPKGHPVAGSGGPVQRKHLGHHRAHGLPLRLRDFGNRQDHRQSPGGLGCGSDDLEG